MKRQIITILLALFAVTTQAKKHKKFNPTQIMASMTVPADWFKTDTICIKGRIEGYDADKFGFTSMECSFDDVFENDQSIVLVMGIAPDGTFCKKFLASYPVQQVFSTTDSKLSFRSIPFFARPGETIDITVRQTEQGKYECVYNSGSSKDVERWLSTREDFSHAFSPLWYFEGKFDEANEVADSVWQMAMNKLQELISSENYTPMETQLAMADVQARFGVDYLGCIVKQADALVKYEKRDGVYQTVILDSAEWKKYGDVNTYEPLRRIDFDNPLLFASQHFYFLQNRIQCARPVDLLYEGGMRVTFDCYSKMLADRLAALLGLMGDDHDNLMAQFCAYKDFTFHFDTFREDGDTYQSMLTNPKLTEEQKQRNIDHWPTLDKMMPIYLDALKHPYFRQKAEQFRDRKLSQKDLTTALPFTPAAALIRKLAAKYPGKFLFIDFWGMSCGPCRAAIQESKELRAEIAKRDDVKLIFIAGESTAEGSDAYKKYVAEWLAGEEAVCVTNQDFTRLQELFGFAAIPHYETITPDCRRVREDLQIQGFYNFDSEFKKLKEKLK